MSKADSEMTIRLDRGSTRKYLEACELQSLFINMLGWDYGGENLDVQTADKTFFLEAIANKCGLVVYQYIAGSADASPDYPTRRKIEKTVAKSVHEHIIIYVTHDKKTQYWQWVKRKSGHPDQMRQESYHHGQSGEALIQKLEKLVFTLSEEEGLTIGDATERVGEAFDVEKVTKKFYDRFKEQHEAFLNFIEGLEDKADQEWYASLMLNRLMFIYFIQKRGFLDDNPDYLKERLEHIKQTQGEGRFHTFYRLFLLKLFHEGLGQPESDRDAELVELLGNVPYLNGGLFDVHTLEQEKEDNPVINIPDEAFEQIFAFFEDYQWHLDDRPLRDDNEINPDVLGYIFEKYINQKQMGAYYTKEDITGYISRNTVIPFLFNQAEKDCPIAFKPGGGVWRLLSDDPDRYIFEATRHGITYDVRKNKPLKPKKVLMPEVARGLSDVSQRGGWNEEACEDYGLPTETWREHVARRQRYDEVYSKLDAGDTTSVNDLITYNLDIEKFSQDVIANSEGPELVRAFWKALKSVSILDPTCGSGAFLFAALNILEPLYTTCLEVMGGMLDDLEHSRRKRHKETMQDFRDVRAQVKQHANERYFILKSIIVNNLYGVDIMEEAVEICKLRLFLKLVAQLEDYNQLEPLPDIDFNIRTGNTLVGFTSLEELQEAFSHDTDGQQNIAYPEENEQLNYVLKNAVDADVAFNEFREMQTSQDVDFKDIRDAKQDLQHQLDELREALDHYLAVQYGINAHDNDSYKEWRDSHQPFHWFVEFYGIMSNGGFDVIIGNPPYLEFSEVDYTTQQNYKCIESGAVHALCIERALTLCVRGGGISMIVPLALVSTQRMTVLQHMLEKNRDCWYSNFSWRPGKLFDTVNRALTIFISIKPFDKGNTYSTCYTKWKAKKRGYLFPAIKYVNAPKNRKWFWAPKLGNQIEKSILDKVSSIKNKLDEFVGKSGNSVYYRTTGGLYWKIFTNYAPKFTINGLERSSSREKKFTLKDAQHVNSAVAILSSNAFWWWYTISSNLRDLNPSDWKRFPVPESVMNDQKIQQLGSEYIDDLTANSTMQKREHKDKNDPTKKQSTTTQFFKAQKSKHIIDKIDEAASSHYGFTDEELDFIINYDIRYRMDDESRKNG